MVKVLSAFEKEMFRRRGWLPVPLRRWPVPLEEVESGRVNVG